ncbi:MAG: DUF4156 domain-containing protein [Pseudobdellovibrio sp.]
MKLTTNRLVIFATFLLLFSCKSLEVTPGSERVRVLDAEPKGCLYVGEVSSVQDESTVGTLETEMDLATRVDLRNKAHALGGNILVFLKGKNTNTLPSTTPPLAMKAGSAKTQSGVAAKASAESAKASETETEKIDTLVFLATVFKCPSSILNQ